MKIFLCNPPVNIKLGPHLGMAYLTAYLEEKNQQVYFQDGNLTSRQGLLRKIEKVKPDLVGIYMNTVTRFEVVDLAEAIKLKLKLPIVVGGPHATIMADQLLRHYDCFDYILRGEAEISMFNLLRSLEISSSLSKVFGLSYRKKNKIFHNENAPFIMDLDKLPFPRHSLFDYRVYPVPEQVTDKGHLVAPMISSRGCPYNCNFCSSSEITSHSYRARSAENVVREIDYLNSIYKVDYIYFQDDHFYLNRKRTQDFCRLMIKKGLAEKVRWRCTGRVDCLDFPTLKLMKKAGCDFICFGVESAVEEGLKFFNKKFTLSQVKRIFDLSRQAGIKRGANFVIGGDHETLATIEKQRELIKELDPEIAGPSVLTVFPGTDLFRLAKSKGLMDESIWLTKFPKIPFHNNVPLYPGPYLDEQTILREAAKITFWWNQMKKKNYHFSFFESSKTVFTYIKAGNFKELINIIWSVALQYLRHLFGFNQNENLAD